jgi:S-adenosylmethionine hydrolase
MKGVILRIQPRAELVDLVHELPPGDILAGALALASSFQFFPPGTVHLVVVDPGVGSSRAAIAVETKNYFFVGPDNGVLSLALGRDRVKSVRQLANPKLQLKKVSRTFHGRDIFAPAAAYLSTGVPLREFGDELPDYERIRFPWPTGGGGRYTGEIIYIDHFGNALTNLPVELDVFRNADGVKVWVGQRKQPFPLVNFYGAVGKGKPLGILGSAGLLEIAVNQGNAASQCGLKVGTRVIVA